MRFSLTLVSRNPKTGPIPIATSSSDTCPPSCPLMGAGCYAETGPLSIVWKKVSLSFEEFLDRVRRIPRKQIWRYGQAGDLPGEGDRIDPEMMDQLVRANAGRPVIAYSHKPPTPENLEVLHAARVKGFVVNLSADSAVEADELAETGCPVVVVLHERYGRDKRKETITQWYERTKNLPKTTPAGRKVAVCPATYTDTNCSRCQVCTDPDRKGVIIGFPAHDSQRRMVSTAVENF